MNARPMKTKKNRYTTKLKEYTIQLKAAVMKLVL